MTPPSFLQGGGAMGARIRQFDWASHPLGEPQHWPDPLKMAVSLCLHSSFPTAIYWGPAYWLLYNDAWAPIPAEKHPACLGRPGAEVWSDIWPIVGPQFDEVLRTGEGFATYEQMLPMVRGGTPRETWWNYSLTAIRHADGPVGGLFNQGHEITEVVDARRQRAAEIERLRAMFAQAPAPIALLEGPEHVFALVNDAYGALVGGRARVGQRLVDALPEVAEQGFIALLDEVYRTGRAHVGSAITVRLQRTPGAAAEERILDFIYQPVRDGAGNVSGIFVLVTDVTDRSRAEAALRISNWQLGEERARLAALVEAEQRAQAALRRFNETLEAHVTQRTAELTRSLRAQNDVADRLRAVFETPLLHQAFLGTAGTLLDVNATALAAAGARREDVVGQPFWATPWFEKSPQAAAAIREDIAAAAAGRTVQRRVQLELATGHRTFEFTLRPARNARGELVGLIPEAIEVAAR